MATKKPKNAEITGNLDRKYWVQKADPLIAMKSVPFTLGELKILDTYISRINAADDTRRTVIFTKEEYEELMGLSCANPRALQKHIKALLSRVPELYMPDDGYISFVLFEKAYYHKDEYGKPIIELTCTETSKDLFFCIGKYHYFKYTLENVINLTRKASYLLYLHIITNRFRGEWELLLDELRNDVLDCKEQESYQEYKIFKRDVLDPAVKEVNKKTDCHFEYETIKRGRKVAKIKFIYHSQEESLALGTMGEDGEFIGQTTLFDEQEQDELTDLLGKDFDNADIDYIRQIIADNGCDMSLVRTAYAKYTLYKNKGRIKNPKGDLGYLSKILNQLIADTKKQERLKPSYDLEKRRELAANFDPNSISFDDTEGM